MVKLNAHNILFFKKKREKKTIKQHAIHRKFNQQLNQLKCILVCFDYFGYSGHHGHPSSHHPAMAAAVAAAGLHPDTDTDPRELEAFAERFKQRRIKLGSYLITFYVFF